MPKERDFLQPKITLAKLGIQLMLSQLLQHKPQMLLMLLLILGVNQDVINEHHNKLIQILHKNFVHQIHELGRCIGQSKRHDCVLIESISSGECSLRNIR
jgi:hypothetical protein